MKQKHTNYVQRNIEKFIVLGALIIAGVIVLIYVAGNPYAVEIAGRKVAPAEVEDVIYQQAVGLREAIDSNKDPLENHPIPVIEYTEDFRDRVNRSIVANEPYPTIVGEPGIDKNQFGPSTANQATSALVAVPTPPAPSTVKLRQGHAVLGSPTGEPVPAGFDRLVKNEAPRDFRYVSVTGKFDMNQWERLLTGGEPDSRMPREWWMGKLLLTRVVLERQTWTPQTQNSSSPTTIKPMPGSMTITTEGGRITVPEAKDLIQQISDNREAIARPDFAPTTATSPTWIRPDAQVTELTPEQQRRVRELKLDIDKLEAQKNRLEKTMPALGDTPGAGITAVDPRLTRTPARGNAPQVQARTRQLQQVNEQLAIKRAELNAIYGINDQDDMGSQAIDPMDLLNQVDPNNPFQSDGFGGFNQPGQPPQPGQFGQPADSETEGQIRVWAHDLSVEPGETYRYRISAMVFNPLFLINDLVEEQRQQYQKLVSLTSSPSPWTEPVEIEENQQFFFVAAQGNKVETELWRLYDGRWVDHRVEVAPGDRISGSVQRQVNGQSKTFTIDTGVFLVDTTPNTGTSRPRGLEVLYLGEPTKGKIASRLIERDRESVDRIRLLNLRDRDADEEPVASIQP